MDEGILTSTKSTSVRKVSNAALLAMLGDHGNIPRSALYYRARG